MNKIIDENKSKITELNSRIQELSTKNSNLTKELSNLKNLYQTLSKKYQKIYKKNQSNILENNKLHSINGDLQNELKELLILKNEESEIQDNKNTEVEEYRVDDKLVYCNETQRELGKEEEEVDIGLNENNADGDGDGENVNVNVDLDLKGEGKERDETGENESNMMMRDEERVQDINYHKQQQIKTLLHQNQSNLHLHKSPKHSTINSPTQHQTISITHPQIKQNIPNSLIPLQFHSQIHHDNYTILKNQHKNHEGIIDHDFLLQIQTIQNQFDEFKNSLHCDNSQFLVLENTIYNLINLFHYVTQSQAQKLLFYQDNYYQIKDFVQSINQSLQ